MKLIDTHCHLYLSNFAADIEAVIQRARNTGVERFYLPGIDSGVFEDMLKLAAAYPGECIPMVGLHPCSVKKNFKDELKIIEQWLAKSPFAAIGEIGLDFYWDTTYSVEQHEAFNLQMEWALQYGRPIVIHSRNAISQTLEAVRPFSVRGLRGIFHCFGDSLDIANEIIDMGFLLGIGGVLTYKNTGLAAVLKEVDLSHMVLETDAPYLPPVPYRGKRNESAYLLQIAEKLAEIKGVPVEEVAAITTHNAEKMLGY